MIKQVTLANGQKIEMHLTEEWDEITFYENDEKLPGEFEFTQGEFNESRFLFRRMYSPIKRQGLGEEALKFFIEETDGVLWTREPNGYRYDDGSYLTEDAPGFIMKMQDRGYIEEWDDGLEDY